MADEDKIDNMLKEFENDSSESESLLGTVLQCSAGINEQNKKGDTALHLAICGDADIDRLRTLMEKGASMNLTNHNGHTPLECLKHGSWKTALNLLKLEKKYNFRDTDGRTLLHQLMDRLGDNIWGIVRPDDMEVGDVGYCEQDELIGKFWTGCLKEIENFNIDLNIQDNYGNTPLHIAADFWPSSKHLDIMLENFDSINPLLVNSDGDTFLHIYFFRYSIREGTDFDNRLLQGELRNLPKSKLETLLNCQNNTLNSPLHVFIKQTENEVNVSNLQKIIKAGANVNLCDSIGYTALHCVLQDYIGGYIDTDDGTMDTELDMSKVEENEERKAQIIRYLIKNGADINAKNKQGESPIFLARHLKSVNALLDCGANINLRNKLKQTPLLSIICQPRIDMDMVKGFLARGADVNSVDMHGSNILHYIAWHCTSPAILPILATHNVKDVSDKLEQLPCHVAYQRGNKELADQLCRCNGNIHSKGEHFTFQREVLELSELNKNISNNAKMLFDRFRHFRGEKIKELLYLPTLGIVNFKDESSLVQSVVNDIVTKICEKIKGKYKFLSYNLMESGSVGENTKVGLPDEFDFLCIFDKLGEMCYIDEQKAANDPGYAYLKVKEEFKGSECQDLFDEKGYLDTFKVRLIFQNVLGDLFITHDLFSHPCISFVKDHFKGANCPTFHFTIRWVGCMYKDMMINIDLVPSCRIKGWWPQNTNFKSLLCDVEALKEQGAVLMLQTDLDDKDDYKPYSKQRISAIVAEKKYMQFLPQIARDAYIVSKILCNSRICPGVRQSHDIEARDVLKSYMLKTCMFHVLHTDKDQNTILHDNVIAKSESYTREKIYDFVLQIFHKLLEFSQNECLPSFFFPWQNVFTFNLDVDFSENHYNSVYRCQFTKMILSILGEIQEFGDMDTTNFV